MKTTPTLLKAFFLALTAILTITACEKENGEDDIPVEEVKDTIAPQQLKDLVATPKNQAVLLEWTNPSDEDFNSTRILYRDKSVIFTKEIDSVVISNLTNGQEYTFELYAQDINGNKAEGVTAKATPDQYLTVIAGYEPKSGSYTGFNKNLVEGLIVDQNHYIYNYTTTYIKEATRKKLNDSTYIFDCSIFTLENGEKILEDTYKLKKNEVFGFDHEGSSYYMDLAFKKIEGEEGLIAGKYRGYNITIRNNDESDIDTIYNYLELHENGEFRYYNSLVNEDLYTGTWTNADILAENYIFVEFSSQLYLVDKLNTRRLYIQE